MNAHDFLEALAVVLGVAAVTTILFQKLGQPVVLGYILAGFIVGPNVPIPLVADREIIQTLSEIGVILLMFSLGLEFSLGKLVKVGPIAGLTALLESSLMVWLGFVAGQAFGWTTVESLFVGAIIAISSTTIIAKAFDEQKVRGPIRELVFGILIVEDLIAIFLMATLTAVASGTGLSATTMMITTGKLLAFLVGLVGVGLLLVPRGVRAVRRLGRPETTLVASVGFCFAVALLAHAFGYSVALGAFIAGSLIAESGEHQEIEHLVQPVRDIFAAVFFVSVGVLIDPAVIAQNWLAVVVLSGVVMGGKILGVSLGAVLTGNGVRTSVQTGMSLAQIGEFSFIIAALGLSLGATRDFVYPVAVAVSAITTLTTPLLIKAAGPVANLVDRKMPHRLQTFVALYASWIEQLKSRPPNTTRGGRIRHLLRLLMLDAALIVLIAVGTSLAVSSLANFLAAKTGLSLTLSRDLVLVVAGVLTLPLGAGIIRVAQSLGLAIAEGALPTAAAGKLDPASTPRRAMVVTLQLGIVLLTGLPILAVTQPVIGGPFGPVFLALLLIFLSVAFWRGAADLQGHVQAGAQAIVNALLEQARGDSAPSTLVSGPAPVLAQVHLQLPGLGVPMPIQLDAASQAVGKSLAQLNLRGVTGATVLAITRGDEGVLVPTATEILRAGDVLALAGTADAIGNAKLLLEVAGLGAGSGPQAPAVG
ncbi:MAG: cation:proton antiporter [Deltaproteobacteria bacterium]|nr:cation:proton antiporter [Deltaproteobacteria bacterium]